ncbi:unnamed protein product [Allacma fusca]|uniref:Uncharacterized protein n=1 Tax=Allacma fusca TaxID=39272 RepID=A0A8J2P160_9HEXA|nr:unnamed protein product [Allacma fusca]
MAVTSTVTSPDVAEAVGGPEDRAGEGADVAEAVGGAEDRAGDEQMWLRRLVEGADVGAAAVLGADVKGSEAGRAEAAGGVEVGAGAVIGA